MDRKSDPRSADSCGGMLDNFKFVAREIVVEVGECRALAVFGKVVCIGQNFEAVRALVVACVSEAGCFMKVRVYLRESEGGGESKMSCLEIEPRRRGLFGLPSHRHRLGSGLC